MRFRRKSPSDAEPREIERAMERVAADDNHETRSALFRALLNTTLVAATPTGPAEERSWTAGEGEQIELVMLGSDDGPVWPVFTSVERLLEWKPEGSGYVALPSRALFEMAEASGAVGLAVNPASATCGEIVRHELETLARGRIPLDEGEAVAEEIEVRIGRPAQPPADEVMAAVRQAVASEKRADAAWLYLMQEGANAPELVVGIALDEGAPADAERTLRAIVEDAGARSPGVEELLFTRVDEDLRDILADGGGDLIFAR